MIFKLDTSNRIVANIERIIVVKSEKKKKKNRFYRKDPKSKLAGTDNAVKIESLLFALQLAFTKSLTINSY